MPTLVNVADDVSDASETILGDESCDLTQLGRSADTTEQQHVATSEVARTGTMQPSSGGANPSRRTMMGATNPKDSAPGTIRGDFAVDIGRNIIHGSDSDESAAREIGIFFSESEVKAWDRSNDSWIVE